MDSSLSNTMGKLSHPSSHCGFHSFMSFLQHEATGSISASSGWDASLLQG